MIAPAVSGILHGATMGNLGSVIAASIIAYPSAVLLGLPAYVLFRKNGWLKMWQALSAGAVLALLPGAAIVYLSNGGYYSAIEYSGSLSVFAVHGAVVSLVFWLFVVWRDGTNK